MSPKMRPGLIGSLLAAVACAGCFYAPFGKLPAMRVPGLTTGGQTLTGQPLTPVTQVTPAAPDHPLGPDTPLTPTVPPGIAAQAALAITDGVLSEAASETLE